MSAPDSTLLCTVCGRQSTTAFASSLRDGWERCCGYTMTLVRTTADVEGAVVDAIGDGPAAAAAAAERVCEQIET